MPLARRSPNTGLSPNRNGNGTRTRAQRGNRTSIRSTTLAGRQARSKARSRAGSRANSNTRSSNWPVPALGETLATVVCAALGLRGDRYPSLTVQRRSIPKAALVRGHDPAGYASRGRSGAALAPDKGAAVGRVGELGCNGLGPARVAGLDALYESHGDFRALCHRWGRRQAGIELLDDVDLGGDALGAKGGEAGGVDVGVDASSTAAFLARGHRHGQGYRAALFAAITDKWVWASSTARGRFWCASVWHTLSDGGRGKLRVADILGTDDGCEARKSQSGSEPAHRIRVYCMTIIVYGF